MLFGFKGFVLSVALIAGLSGCDSKTLQGLAGGNAVENRRLPTSGTQDLAKMPGIHYQLKNIEITAYSAEFKSSSVFKHELVLPGMIQPTRDVFSGKGQWAPEDTTQRIDVDLCIPLRLDLTKAKPIGGPCVNYRPAIAGDRTSVDVWNAERGIPIFSPFIVGTQRGERYEITNGETVMNATARSYSEGGLQILEEIFRSIPSGSKPFLGEVSEYYVELTYIPE